MNTFFRAALTALALLLAGSAFGVERTVTLVVENADCVACAPIVKRTLSRMPGVSRVAVVEQAGAASATVSFEEGRVTPEALAIAVTNAGFPAHVREN